MRHRHADLPEPADDPHHRPHASTTSRRRPVWLLLAAATLLSLTVPGAGAMPRPLDHGRTLGDPSVTRSAAQQYVAVATGPRVVRMVSSDGVQWHRISPALLARPGWARPRGAIWAADLVQLGGRWLLYYAAPVRGMGRTSRCIGVAASATSTGRFRPVGRRPLVCPGRARTPRAEDRVLDGQRKRTTYPTTGVIDPSVLVDRGRVLLLYKTDGTPSSIRLLRLHSDGLHAAGRSRRLVSSRGVVENPVMVRRGRWFYLFTSTGDYTRCSYATTWRRSRSLLRWRGHPQHVLLSRRRTGLCGPGGADVVVGRGVVRMYFHGWTCRGTARPCAAPFHLVGHRERYRHPVRALYGARLVFTRRGVVHVSGFLAGTQPRHARPTKVRKAKKSRRRARQQRAKKHATTVKRGRPGKKRIRHVGRGRQGAARRRK